MTFSVNDSHAQSLRFSLLRKTGKQDSAVVGDPARVLLNGASNCLVNGTAVKAGGRSLVAVIGLLARAREAKVKPVGNVRRADITRATLTLQKRRFSRPGNIE